MVNSNQYWTAIGPVENHFCRSYHPHELIVAGDTLVRDRVMYSLPLEPQGPWVVECWGSHPDEGNDDCDSGVYFARRQDAEKAFEDCFSTVKPYIKFVVLAKEVGCKWRSIKERENPNFVSTPDNDDWRREYAHQMGMAFGCQGYNDAMGY